MGRTLALTLALTLTLTLTCCALRVTKTWVASPSAIPCWGGERQVHLVRVRLGVRDSVRARIRARAMVRAAGRPISEQLDGRRVRLVRVRIRMRLRLRLRLRATDRVEVKGWGWGSVRRTGAVASGARKVGLIEW